MNGCVYKWDKDLIILFLILFILFKKNFINVIYVCIWNGSIVKLWVNFIYFGDIVIYCNFKYKLKYIGLG